MGNIRSSSPTASLKEAIQDGNLEKFQAFLESSTDPSSLDLDMHLNKKGDTPVLFAARCGNFAIVKYLLERGCNVNQYNSAGHTVLDLWLSNELPDDSEILHQHFCPFNHSSPVEEEFKISDPTQFLLMNGAVGIGVQRLILYSMKRPHVINNLMTCIRDLCAETAFRISGLLLQVTVWFEQTENLRKLLTLGVDVMNFWRAPFAPSLRNLIDLDYDFHAVVNSRQSFHGKQAGEWYADLDEPVHTNRRTHRRSAAIDRSAYQESLQNLKLSFIEDWRVDWNEGENPVAQFRAGLHITPKGAIMLIRAANTFVIIEQVIIDISGYRPAIVGGPDLDETNILDYLLLSGYKLAHGEERWMSKRLSIESLDNYNQVFNAPQTLKQLVKVRIRHSLQKNVFYGVAHLPEGCLPQELKDFLTLGSDRNLPGSCNTLL